MAQVGYTAICAGGTGGVRGKERRVRNPCACIGPNLHGDPVAESPWPTVRCWKLARTQRVRRAAGSQTTIPSRCRPEPDARHCQEIKRQLASKAKSKEAKGKESIFINNFIHRRAKLSNADFLKRVANVKAIRTEQCPSYKVVFRTYIQDAHDWLAVEYLSNAIQKGDFSGIQTFLEGEYVFGLIVSDEVAKWFKACPGSVVQRQIVTWLSYLWATDPGKEDVLRDQLFPPVFYEVKQLHDKFFPTRNVDGPPSEKELGELQGRYLEACRFYFGSEPPEILACPPNSLGFDQYAELRNRWGFETDMFEFTVKTFYFTDTDWQEIVINERGDELRRAESLEDVWAKWKSAFMRDVHEYAMYLDGDHRGTIYLIGMQGASHVKIGFTAANDAEKRMSALQTGNSSRLFIIGQFSCASSFAERSLHEKFREKSLHGEWFDLNRSDIENILNPGWRTQNFIM